MKPVSTGVRKSAPAAMSAATTSAWPWCAAHMRAGGGAVGGELVVGARAAGEEGLHDGEAAGAGSGHEGRLAAAKREIGIGAGVEGGARPWRRNRWCRREKNR